jgi:hypothetical protein
MLQRKRFATLMLSRSSGIRKRQCRDGKEDGRLLLLLEAPEE